MVIPAFVYILANRPDGALYIGVTTDPLKRIWEHKNGVYDGFTRKYGIDRLVYIEAHGDPYHAITREKQMKKWRRAWKVALIEKANPEWRDLYPELV